MPAPHPKQEEAIKLRKKGLPYSEIAARLGVKLSTIQNIGRRVQLTSEQQQAIFRKGRRKAGVSRTKETATHKYCPRCERTLAREDFHKRGRYLMGYCKECQRAYVSKNRKAYRGAIRLMLTRAKTAPCADCEEVHPPWAMDFDHVRGEKKFNLSSASAKGFKISTVLEEMAKCEVVCALCHRYRTYGERRKGQ